MSCLEECQESILGYANLLSGCFTLAAIAISTYQVARHLSNYSNPYFQNKIIMILFMAPFYALTSFVTILTQDSKGYFALIRDIYEAILIYAFFNLLSSYLAYDTDLKCINYDRIYSMLSDKGVIKHLWPMNFIFKDLILISDQRGRWFFRSCRLYILQYLAIKPTVAFLQIILVYVSGSSTWLNYFFQAIVFVSVSLSLYYLVFFYKILHFELDYAKPLLKFLSIKGVLFFTFWQDMAFYAFKVPFLSLFGNPDEERGEVLIAISECLFVCFEMVILSIMTTIAFSYKDFKEIERKDSLLKKQGVFDLGRRLMKNVIPENFINTFTDLKDLGSPIKKPFKSYKPSQVKTNALLLDQSQTSNASTANSLDHFVQVFEPPVIMEYYENQEVVERTA